MADIYSYTQTEIDQKLASKSNEAHTHKLQDLGVGPVGTWTPTIIADSTVAGEESVALSWGNAQQKTGRYWKMGEVTFFSIHFAFGSTTGPFKEKCNLTFTLPAGTSVTGTQAGGGLVYKDDTSARQVSVWPVGSFEGVPAYGFVEDGGHYLDVADWNGSEILTGNFWLFTG